MRKRGTLLPGPLEMKCVLFSKCLTINQKELSSDLRVVKRAVSLDCLTSFVLLMKKNLVFAKI